MKSKLSTLAGGLAVLALAAVISANVQAKAANITYDLIPVIFTDTTFPGGIETLTGTITTDGTITSSTTPYLSTSNIISWSFSLSNPSVRPDRNAVSTALQFQYGACGRVRQLRLSLRLI